MSEANASKGKMWQVYILACRDGAFYVGVTDDLARRFHEHVSGNGGHYTSCHRPVKILYHESFGSRLQAEKRESQIKRWSRSKKLALIRGDQLALKKLSRSRTKEIRCSTR
jgi:predicted GIY-YIG superfamily endonuclease